ncbi:hypothetical protein MDA_GLEAN10011156 [Myotis davidii]|uniref:Uncharacterized protein n=1 Tax=Myotis davidii TaxID=225400 RepID=L5MFX8_MYODS|nr:hypothetical protein MDA_GLEAN10011156 [Myotis davidii]
MNLPTEAQPSAGSGFPRPILYTLAKLLPPVWAKAKAASRKEQSVRGLQVPPAPPRQLRMKAEPLQWVCGDTLGEALEHLSMSTM